MLTFRIVILQMNDGQRRGSVQNGWFAACYSCLPLFCQELPKQDVEQVERRYCRPTPNLEDALAL